MQKFSEQYPSYKENQSAEEEKKEADATEMDIIGEIMAPRERDEDPIFSVEEKNGKTFVKEIATDEIIFMTSSEEFEELKMKWLSRQRHAKGKDIPQ